MSLLDVFRIVGAFLLPLALLLFFHSGLFGRLMERLLMAATAETPSVEKSRLPSRVRKEHLKRQKTFFWALTGAIGLLVLIDLFALPASFQVPTGWLLPIVVASFEVGVLVIFVGPIISYGRANWTKWTFWVSLGTTAFVLLWVSHLLASRNPKGAFGLLFFSLLQFLWTFGILGRLDRDREELQDANCSPGN